MYAMAVQRSFLSLTPILPNSNFHKESILPTTVMIASFVRVSIVGRDDDAEEIQVPNVKSERRIWMGRDEE